MRLLIVGNSGAGKSTLAREVAAAAGLRHVELDELHWGPQWTPKPRERFIELVVAAAAGDAWVIDGNYSAVRDLLWPRATHVVWLDYRLATVMRRVCMRTLRRALAREPLWHGNRESLTKALLSPESILLWALTTYRRNRERYTLLQRDERYAHLRWTVLTDPARSRDTVRALAAEASRHRDAALR